MIFFFIIKVCSDNYTNNNCIDTNNVKLIQFIGLHYR